MHRVHGTRLRTGTGVDFVPHPYLYTAVLRTGAQRSTVRQVGLRVDFVPSPSCLVLCSSCRRRVIAGSWTRGTTAVPVSSYCASVWHHFSFIAYSFHDCYHREVDLGNGTVDEQMSPEARQHRTHRHVINIISFISHLVHCLLLAQRRFVDRVVVCF